MKKFIDYTVTAVTVLLAALAIVLIVYQPVLLGTVSGSSMEPTFSDGDKFVYTSVMEPEVNDIIVFKYDQREVESQSISVEEEVLVVHRIIEKESNTEYITKGDNNQKSDGVIMSSDIRGVAVLQYDQDKRTFKILT